MRRQEPSVSSASVMRLLALRRGMRPAVGGRERADQHSYRRVGGSGMGAVRATAPAAAAAAERHRGEPNNFAPGQADPAQGDVVRLGQHRTGFRFRFGVIAPGRIRLAVLLPKLTSAPK
ncbi:hypothetical protein GCM10020219_042780 [Nonomuraea dietziae]